MAKKVKYYGVLAIKSMNTKHCDDFPEELKDFINAVKKKTTVARVFVFDNETEQVKCLANVEGCDHLIDIEAVSKEDFLNQVLSLKAKFIYNDDDDDVESDDEDPGETPSPC